MQYTGSTRMLSLLALLILFVLALPSCRHEPLTFPEDPFGSGGGNGGGNNEPVDPCDPDSVYFQNTVLPLLVTYCAGEGCHDAITHEEGVRLYDYSHIMQSVEPGNPNNSDLWDDGINENGNDAMPPAGEPQMTAAQEQAIYTWIMQGAQDNGCSQCDTTNITYSGHIQPLFQNKCNGCHSGASPDGALDLTNFTICNTVALDGRLAGAVMHQYPYSSMPPSGNMLPQCEIDQILYWIDTGAPNN